MNKFLRQLKAMSAFGREARGETYRLLADLLETGIEVERALEGCRDTWSSQGQKARADILAAWARGAGQGRLGPTIAEWVPAAEGMVFAAADRVPPQVLFTAAAAVADLGGKQKAAVLKAVAMPIFLFGAVILMLFLAGGWFVPVLEEIVAAENWDTGAAIFRFCSLWLYNNMILFCGLAAALVATLWVLTLYWTGPGRAMADSWPPFSFYRTVTGSAFLNVILALFRAGVDVNDAVFEQLKAAASPYGRHRIGAIQNLYTRGHLPLGVSMVQAGHGFPEPSLIPVIRLLEGQPDWENKLGKFVDRWIERLETLLKNRATVVNIVLYLIVGVLTACAVQAMFSIVSAAGDSYGI